MVTRSNAMTGPAWISMALDRALEQALEISEADKQAMTTQQYNLSLDLGTKVSDPTKVTDSAHELERRLGSGESQQAFLRDRRLAIESALEKSRHDVAGTVDTKFENGKVRYMVVDSGDASVQRQKSDSEYKAWSLKVDLTTSAGAPVSNLGRNAAGEITDSALVACKSELEQMVSKLAGLTANQYSRIPKVIEDLKKASDAVRKKVVADLAATAGHNEELLEKLKSDLKV